ncbi:hypothetical protein VNO78_03482 [Psophocarpus tetragonolobus]|uniref:Uncharacterized protein n=1 Tax=Psophocarpus tetragonolobus TaxID=3891 RepID=A0AAN9XVZ1_PSOTE
MFVSGDNKFLRGSLWSYVGTKQCLHFTGSKYHRVGMGIRMGMYFFFILGDVFFVYTREALRFFSPTVIESLDLECRDWSFII